MDSDLMTDKLGCAGRTVTASARHIETEAPKTIETAAGVFQERPCELFEGGLGI